MNIFVLDIDPVRCAQAHCDKHVIKMILETAQLLSTAHHVLDGEGRTDIYRRTHAYHPCSVWVRQSRGNYEWLHELGMALCTEYTHRYGKVHKTEAVMRRLEEPPLNIQRVRRTPFAQAMPPVFQVHNDGVRAYRKYYAGAKTNLLKYTNRQPPSWLNTGE
jgi:Pyrimidine dimer DNA glycosylase